MLMNKLELKKLELGFGNINTNRPYAPLLLYCLVSGYCEKHYLNRTSYANKINLNDVQYARLWVMCGRNGDNGRELFFRTEGCSALFREKNNQLKLIFNAEQFFEMYKHASKANSKKLFEQSIVIDKNEIAKFRGLLKENAHLLSDRKIARAETWLNLLK